MQTKLLGAVCALVAFGGVQLDANAGQVNTHGFIFQTNPNTISALQYVFGDAYNFSGGTIPMYAAAPRQPGGGAVTVYVDGASVNGTYSCSVSTRGSTKTFQVVSSPTSWTKFVNFTAAQAPTTSYISVTCDVPPDGALFGITVVG